jgi:excisionase family DNA binding protein
LCKSAQIRIVFLVSTDDEREWIKTGEASRRLGISRSTLTLWCNEGRLAYVRSSQGGDRMIPVSELRRLEAEAQRNRTQPIADAARQPQPAA